MTRNRRHFPWLVLPLLAAMTTPARAISLADAVATAVTSHPSVSEALSERLARRWELKGARGAYLPSLDAEIITGPQWTDSVGTRARGDGTLRLHEDQASLTFRETIFDGLQREREVDRREALLGAAGERVLVASELVALDTCEAYLDVLRQSELVRLGRENVDRHQSTLGDVSLRQKAGRGSVADTQQSRERLAAAQARLAELERARDDAGASFLSQVGVAADAVAAPELPVGLLPENADAAAQRAVDSAPSVAEAEAQIDAANAAYRSALAPFLPTLGFEANARHGRDLDGIRGEDNQASALLVLRQNIFAGGVDRARRQAARARLDGAKARRDRIARDVAEFARQAFNAWDRAREGRAHIEDQAAAITEVRESYAQQFRIGARSLLDLLDTDTSLFQTRVALENALFQERNATCRLLAAEGGLLAGLGVARPEEVEP